MVGLTFWCTRKIVGQPVYLKRSSGLRDLGVGEFPKSGNGSAKEKKKGYKVLL